MKYIKTFENHSIINNQFWGTIGAGILPFSKKTDRFLLTLRSEFVKEPETWGTWGGKLDDMETNDPREAAKIEFKEESDYSGKIKLIDAYIYKKKDDNGNVIFKYYNYIGIIDEEFEPVLDWETSDYKWLTVEELYNIEPKHFGLDALLKNSKEIIYKILKN